MTTKEALHALSVALYSGAPIPADALEEVQTGLNSETTAAIEDVTGRVTGLESSAGMEPGASLVYTKDEMDEKLEPIEAPVNSLPDKLHAGDLKLEKTGTANTLTVTTKAKAEGGAFSTDGTTAVTFDTATAENAGLLSAEDKKKLEDATTPFVKKEQKGSNGTALIFNEGDGGGAKFTRTTDQLESFVGVHDGSGEKMNSLAAQIYADKLTDGKWDGTHLNVFQDRIVYLNQKTRKQQPEVENNDEKYELAVKKDVQALEDKLTKLEARVEQLAGAVVNERVVDGIVAMGIQTANEKIKANGDGAYATLTGKLDSENGGEVTVTITKEETEIHKVFLDVGAWVLRVLVDNADRITTIHVKDHEESKVTLPMDRSVEGEELKKFVKASGLLQGVTLTGKTKLKELKGKSFIAVVTDMNGKTYEYTLKFEPGSEAA